MEYLLFVTGAFIIVLSLVLTFKSQSNNDDYYFENEILAELRELKRDMDKGGMNKGGFSDLLTNKVFEKEISSEFIEINKGIGRLVQKNEEVLKKVESIETKIDKNSSIQSIMLEEKVDSNNENVSKEYCEIKELLEKELTLAEVAKKLGMGTREVELICKINARREKNV